MIPRGLKDAVAITPPFHQGRVQLHGRDEPLAELVDLLDKPDQPACLLHGPDGSGKTAIAAELARQAHERGYDVWWLNAPDHATLVAGICAVADDLGLTGPGLPCAELREAVWRRLQTRRRPWLLVVDGVDEPGRVTSQDGVPSPASGWLRPARTGPGLVLVTTRAGDESLWGRWWRRFFVGPVDDIAAAAILRDQLDERSASEVDMTGLARATTGLPLALRMVGANSAATISSLGHHGTPLHTQHVYGPVADLQHKEHGDPLEGDCAVHGEEVAGQHG